MTLSTRALFRQHPDATKAVTTSISTCTHTHGTGNPPHTYDATTPPALEIDAEFVRGVCIPSLGFQLRLTLCTGDYEL